MSENCVFCRIIDGQAPGEILQVWDDAIAIVPLNPVTPDHTLIIPCLHVEDASTNPVTTAITARRAAQIVRPGQHSAVNVGSGAGQTVFHLHQHVWSCLGGTKCMPWGCPQ